MTAPHTIFASLEQPGPSRPLALCIFNSHKTWTNLEGDVVILKNVKEVWYWNSPKSVTGCELTEEEVSSINGGYNEL